MTRLPESRSALVRLPISVEPGRRLIQLMIGLALYGGSIGLIVRGRLGLDPWDVLNQGVSKRFHLDFGLVTAIIGGLVLLAWIPLRQRPGVGTALNIVLIAVGVDAVLAVVPAPSALAPRVILMVAGVTLNGLATAVYVGARLGPGPRDGLMTGLAARTGWSIRLIRTSIEVTVLAAGWLLGGTVGAGTVLYAVMIGPLIQLFLPRCTWRSALERAS